MLCFLTQLSPMSPLNLPALIESSSAKLCDKHQEYKDCLNPALSLRQSSGKWHLFFYFIFMIFLHTNHYL